MITRERISNCFLGKTAGRARFSWQGDNPGPTATWGRFPTYPVVGRLETCPTLTFRWSDSGGLPTPRELPAFSDEGTGQQTKRKFPAKGETRIIGTVVADRSPAPRISLSHRRLGRGNRAETGPSSVVSVLGRNLRCPGFPVCVFSFPLIPPSDLPASLSGPPIPPCRIWSGVRGPSGLLRNRLEQDLKVGTPQPVSGLPGPPLGRPPGGRTPPHLAGSLPGRSPAPRVPRPGSLPAQSSPTEPPGPAQ